ncbi:hypothetical protein EDD21DRAFT_9335 [Dissophora ornata]|nr:hypothetical protein BGZ58_002369 [Dissophora ornata]KAI8596278.1 hypothetical protein EDD21DRAFT_9335 [Dissophora ornata]
MTATHNSRMSCETAAAPADPTLLQLPTEVLANIIQYLVEAYDLRHYLHLSQTCKTLHATLWEDGSAMWLQVYIGLYDPIRKEGPNEVQQSNNCTVYRQTVVERHWALQTVRLLGVHLDKALIPWKTRRAKGMYCGRQSDMQQPVDNPQRHGEDVRALRDTEIQRALVVLIDIAREHVSKNLHWVQNATTSDVWAYATYLWFRQLEAPAQRRKMRGFHSVEVICDLFAALGQIASIDPYILTAFYANKYESFRYIRGALFREEDLDIHNILVLNGKRLHWFPWSMCEVFFMVMFCGPSVYLKEMVVNPSNYFRALQRSSVQQQQLQPSWFNLGANFQTIVPIPLIGPGLCSSPQHRYRMTGQWMGYYAYQMFVPLGGEDNIRGSDEDGEDGSESVRTLQPIPEYAVRGLRVDKRMSLRLVDWTNDTLNHGSSYQHQHSRHSSCAGAVDNPLYLCSKKDMEVMTALDEVFYMYTSHEDIEASPLPDSACWAYQRVFSGRGSDAIGEFGIRGVISERSGLVRMVKSYFQANELGAVGNRVYFEFGEKPGELKYDMSGRRDLWYYRGQMGPAGILGIWYDGGASGPFWMYRVD